MKNSTLLFMGRQLTLSVLAACLWLSSCGGTQIAGGVGSGGSGVAEGTVSGFGSVIVEGVTYGDSNASVVRNGETAISEAKLGQRVRVEYDGDQQASRITVLPQLLGSASTSPNAQGDFWLLGQRVRIIGDGNSSLPATVFDGLTQVTTGNALEVHGSWSQDQGQNVLIASRIEKLASLPSAVLLTAPVLSRGSNSLVLDDNNRTVVQASGIPDSVQVGGLVSFWLQASALGNTPWVAQQVLDANPQASSEQRLNLSAVVNRSDNSAIRVQGLDIRLPANWSGAPPSVGTPVNVQLQRQGTQWVASSLSTASPQSSIELKGSITWPSGNSTLAVRNTTVDLRAGQALGSSCSGLRPGDEVYVSVNARRGPPGQIPQATQVECSAQIPSNSVQEGSGTLLSVSSNAVTVLVRGNNLSLNITDRSLIPPNLNALINRTVEVEYQRSGNANVLRKLKPD